MGAHIEPAGVLVLSASDAAPSELDDAIGEALDGMREARGALHGCVDALAIVLAARVQDLARHREQLELLREGIAEALSRAHLLGRVAERAVERAVLAEATVERARVATEPLQALAARGSPAAREAVAALVAALGGA